MSIKKDLELVNKYQKELGILSGVQGLLEWDMQVYMPKKGNDARAEQMSFVEVLAHEKLISEELFSALKKLKKEKLSEDEKIIVKRLYRDVERARKLPKKFVEELSKITSLGFSAWQKARKENNFKIFQPYLEKIVELKRKEAEYINLPGHPYNSLIDDYEEGMTVEKLKPKFEKLKKDILKLLKTIKDSETYKNQKYDLMKKKFSRENQLELAKDVMRKIGLVEAFSRMDIAEHPFTVRVGHGDVRITTNVRDAPLFAFQSTMHEAGHGLYEANLPKEHIFNVLYDAPSLGMHESQSRFWENMIGKSKPFWRYYFNEFGKRFKIDDFDKWYKELNFIFPSKIRIEADEVQYPLHIILRFELEIGLIEGSIEVKDLPEIWNKKMKELLNVTLKNDREGVLQDVHWSEGYFGYFPTYAIGSIYSAQLYETLKKEFPEIEEDMEKGKFEKIQKWLEEKVHKHGRKMLAEEIIKNVCGEGLNPDVYINYLKNKYFEIYNLR